jgi:uncharacterized membrane protein
MVENTVIAILTGKEAIAAYIAIAATVVSVITFFFERKRFRATVLIEEMRTLNDIKHREKKQYRGYTGKDQHGLDILLETFGLLAQYNTYMEIALKILIL